MRLEIARATIMVLVYLLPRRWLKVIRVASRLALRMGK